MSRGALLRLCKDEIGAEADFRQALRQLGPYTIKSDSSSDGRFPTAAERKAEEEKKIATAAEAAAAAAAAAVVESSKQKKLSAKVAAAAAKAAAAAEAKTKEQLEHESLLVEEVLFCSFALFILFFFIYTLPFY